MSFAQDMKARLRGLDTSMARRFAENIASGVLWLRRKPQARGHPVLSYGETRLTLLAIAVAGTLIALTLLLDFRVRTASWIWALDGSAIRMARHLPHWVIAVFNELTDFGKSGWFLWPLGIALLAIAMIAAVAPLTRMSRLVLATIAVRLEFLFLAIALPGIFTNIVKRFFGRGRPFVGGDVDVYLPFDARAAYASLPSGHATTAFSALVAFGVLFPKARPYLWAYAAIIAISRVVVIAHHPTDVLAGALVGSLGAFLVLGFFALRRRALVIDPRGLVRAMAGPSFERIKTVARSIRGP